MCPLYDSLHVTVSVANGTQESSLTGSRLISVGCVLGKQVCSGHPFSEFLVPCLGCLLEIDQFCSPLTHR